MALGPKEKQEKQLENAKKIVDFLEKDIDKQLEKIKSVDKTVTVGIGYANIRGHIDVNLLDKNPLVEKEIKRRYAEKGWKDVQFKWIPSSSEDYEFRELEIYFIES